MATRDEWARRVKGWEASGLDAAAFAAREGLVAKSLLWWRWKLRSTPAAAASEPRFVPVRVVDTTVRAPCPSSTDAAIEIALPNGRVVRVTAGFDPSVLTQVLAIASSAPGDEAC
ncbi:MAG: IS66 family insertion sequence element accessory protein TnpB [Minicystis sp.]